MSGRQHYHESGFFDFHRNGNASRRDRDADPRVLLIDISPDNRGARLHFAGDTHIRVAWINDLSRDTDTIAGMSSEDAFRLGRCANG